MFKVIVGPVKAGKSRALLQRCEDIYTRVRLFSAVNSQMGGQAIKSRNSDHTEESIPISKLSEVLHHIDYPTPVTTLLVDEVQFLEVTPEELIYTLRALGKRHIDLIVYGLDMDYKGMPFMSTATCMSMADKVIKVHGHCDICKTRESSMSLRMLNNKPVPLDDKVELVQLDGTGETTYLTVCRECFNKAYEGMHLT